MAVFDFSGLGNIGRNLVNGYQVGRETLLDDQRRQTLAELGKGPIDYNKAASALLASGDASGAIGLLGLAQKEKDRQAESDYLRRFRGIPGSGGIGGTPSSSPPVPVTSGAGAGTEDGAAPSQASAPSALPAWVGGTASLFRDARGVNNAAAYTPDGSFSRYGDLHKGMTQQAEALRSASPQIADASAAAPAAPADLPEKGSVPAQGFVVPGADNALPSLTSPRLQELERWYAAAPTDRSREIVRMHIDREREAIKARVEAERGPASVQEFEWARRRGMTKAKTPAEYEREKKEGRDEGTIPPGYRAVRDEGGNIARLEAIPGSEAAKKVEDAQKKASLQQQQTEASGNAVFNAIDDIDRLMKGAILPTTGGTGSLAAAAKGTAAHDVASALNTVKANISFERLNQMRQSSPTGGALGSVTEGEHKLLSNSMAALDQSQSEAQFKTNLGRVRANFERIVHGRTLSAQERRGGGPMTGERARTLREEARAAIAGGAPREAVAKRLSEKYGIDGSGL